jgi:DNA methylase
VAGNVQAHGTGALNVDGCRIDSVSDGPGTTPASPKGQGRTMEGADVVRRPYDGSAGRWPANVVLDEDAARTLDESVESSVSRQGQPREGRSGEGWGLTATGAEYDDQGGPSRFFYVAKASSAERNAGLDGFEDREGRDTYGDGLQGPRPHTREDYEWERKSARNPHPTVKPIDLMRWLVRLVTPPGGTVLDPFAGSGTTGIAAVLEGFDFVGVEREADYLAIAEARIAWWARHPQGVDVDDALAADAVRRRVAATGQLDLLAGEAA